MAGSPQYKVHNPKGDYIAACRFTEDAAALVALYGDGARIKHHGRIVYTEGKDGNASESYDAVATIVRDRIYARARDRGATVNADGAVINLDAPSGVV